jgi:uncharacterized protein (TIGR02099 family)
MTHGTESRLPLDHRLRGLLPFIAYRPLRVLWRTLVWGFWIVYFSFVVLVLALRYGILPHIEAYRGDVERLVSGALGQTVSIGRIEASWDGINPDLTLLEVRIADAEGRPALAFSRVEVILSWWSVPSAQLKLRLLRIDQPTLNLRRDAEGHYFVAGIPVSREVSDNNVADWVLGLRRIRVRGATLIWDDELRQAPQLTLRDLDFALDNNGQRHAFGLTARPPAALASMIDIRGDFRGSDFDRMQAWSGKIYAGIAYADLAVWRQWIDYPVGLAHGRGALRAWLEVNDGSLREITADVSLQDVNLRLAKDLPALELDRMSGRFGARFSATGFEVEGRQVELVTRAQKIGKNETRETIRVEPSDFRVDWQPAADGQTVVGSASASRLDLGALARLAEHLPFDARSHRLLNDYAPRGRVSGLAAKWKADADTLQSYSLQADFDELALRAQGYFPGFSGLSGVLEANEHGGSATLRSKSAAIDLPRVFPESLIALDTLSGHAKWKLSSGVLDVDLSRVEFSSADAAGTAQGSYRTSGQGPGSIDLTAALSRGDARAVWRYMPRVVGAGARQWLRDSLLAGYASEAKLTLKGDLSYFPFVDKSKGQFLVTVKAKDAVLDYAEGWPRIEGIDGNLRFEGKGMTIEAQRGAILGAQLSNTRAEVPDLSAPVSMLIVKGKADGPTSEFLKFIDRSPVAARIDHFTEDMRASGNGHLDLSLTIPLDEAKLGDSKIDGSYRLASNEVTVDAALPPLKQVNGSVQFSGSDLRVPEITATLFGGPLSIKGGSQKDGRVLITANGSVSVAQLRQQSASPLLEKLAGSTAYQGEVHINKRNADLVIESMLVGLESSLPEPFNKEAGASLALRFEKRLLPPAAARKGEPGEGAARDQLSATLGNALSLQLIRRRQADGYLVERGAIAVGRPLRLPESGVALGLTAKRVDLDYWQRLLRPAKPGAAPQAAAASAPALDSVSIKTPELLIFGRLYNDVDLAATATPAQWKIALSSQQASGDLQWDNAGGGKLTARLRQMTIDPSTVSKAPDAGEAIKELPALDIIADNFSIGQLRLGRLEVLAHNEGSIWRLSKIQATNPHGVFAGSGQWLVGGGRNRTQLDFKIDSDDVGKLLERLGFPGTVRAGSTEFGGRIGWDGPPSSLDYASLNGELNLEASKGQFLKLDPGAAKLLGLISLQSLPRRITLDFKDVFSEGFAFDSINSKLTVQNGTMRTDRLQIDGTSARVVMHGEVDLKRETQRLNVNVQPELGGTAALGVALVNPLAGVATWVAHKMLQSPLNHMFGFDYLVTGTWEDPKVEKLARNAPQEAVPRLPTISNAPGGANDNAEK